jgi:hypothetical protein
LRAGYNGKTWSYKVVDGNGTQIVKYTDIETRQAQVMSAAQTPASIRPMALQIFYRDMSEGIPLPQFNLGKLVSGNIR